MSSKHYKAASFGRLVMLFCSIMLVFLALTAQQTDSKLQTDYQRQTEKNLEISLDEVISKTSEQSYIFARIQSIEKSAINNGFDSNEFNAAINACKNTYHTSMKVFAYKDTKLVRHINAVAEEMPLLEPLMHALSLSGEEFNQAQRDLHSKLQETFGPGNRLELMKLSQGQLRRYRFGEQDMFYYWKTHADGKGLFFIVNNTPAFLNRFSICFPDNPIFGAGNSAKTGGIPPLKLTPDQMQAAKLKAGLQGQNTTRMFDHLWYFVEDSNGDFWCRVVPEKAIKITKPAWAANVFMISALLALASLIFYLTASNDLRPGKNLCELLDSLSVRYRIIGLFAMASIFPVIFTILIGVSSLTDRVEVIENSILSESIAAIEPLEKMYIRQLTQKDAAAKELRELFKTAPASEEIFQKILKKHNISRNLSRLEVRDGQGDTLFTTDDRAVHGVAEAMDIFSRMALKIHAPQRMGSAINKVTPAEIVSESVLSTDEIGMATIMRQRGRQWFFRMGTFPTTWYWDVYPELASGPAFMCMTTQLVVSYKHQLETTLAAQSSRKDNIQLATEMNYHHCDFSIFPQLQNLDHEKLLTSAVSACRTGRVIFREMEISNRNYWMTVKAEKNIDTTVFFHLISQSERLNSLTPLKWKLASGAVLALIVSMLGAILIIRLIITPVSDLGAGIKAIRERQSEFRTPIRRNDELGKLAAAFNKVISELKELEYGRIVQESLLPKEAPRIPGYDLARFNASATDLAGDYHDMVALDDGRIAIILGDVTGHGISAALAMAMAKATVTYAGNDGKLYPTELMESLNALFNKELKPRHKFMTLMTIVIEPETGKLEIENAGQSYPRYYIAAEDSSIEIQLPSMPLGAMKKRRGKTDLRYMKAGDAIILYSDGIIECSDENEEMYGYDRFYDHFTELMRRKTPAEQALKEMMQTLNDFRQPGPFPDDVTLVILKRLQD